MLRLNQEEHEGIQLPSKDSAEKENEKLREILENVKSREGILGYILRGSNSASIDLKDPTEIIDYALLSATAFETAQDISSTFEIGEAEAVVLEGEEKKILLTTVNDHRLSVFMEKNVDHDKLRKDLDLA